MKKRVQQRKGAVLIFVMGILFMLASLLVVFISRMRYQIEVNLRDSANSELRRTAYSGLEVALAVMNAYKEMDGGLYAPSQGWQDALELAEAEFYGGEEVSLRFEDETGKIPLAGADVNRMEKILEQLGFDEYTALQMLDKYQDWIDADDLERLNGAEQDYYMDRPIPYEPANRDLLSMQEFRLIGDFDLAFFDAYGQPNELFEVLESFYSTVNNGQVNINSVDERLFLMGDEFSVYEQESFWAYLAGDDGVRGTHDDRYFENTSNVPTSISSLDGVSLQAKIKYIWVIVDVRRGDQRFELRALVSVDKSDSNSGDYSFARFKRDEMQYRIVTDAEKNQEISNIRYPFKILKVEENGGAQ